MASDRLRMRPRGERGTAISRGATETATPARGRTGPASDGEGFRTWLGPGQLVLRTYPQMAQVARPVSGSSSRKLGQPLVPQKKRGAAFARRRIRRIADARPVTDDVVVRVIMLCLSVLSGAPSSRYRRSAARPGSRSSGIWFDRETSLSGVCAPGRERSLGALTGSSRRTGYLRSMRAERASVKPPMVRPVHLIGCRGRPGARPNRPGAEKVQVSSPKLG
jgi:hypothetical protein